MSNVIQFKSKKQLDFKRPVRLQNAPEYFEDGGDQLQLIDNVEANINYLTRNDLINLVKNSLFMATDSIGANDSFQSSIDTREADRQRRAQRKHLRSLIERIADSDTYDHDAYDEFLDAVLDAKNSNIISQAVAINIENSLSNFVSVIWDYIESLFLDESVQEERFNAVLSAQAKLNRYVYYLVR